VAVVAEGQALSYRTLNAKANQLAHYLRAQGVGPDERVALGMERGVELVIALLAVLKAGGTYVPLDLSYPVERLAFMLADSAPTVLLTALGPPAALESLSIPVLNVAAVRPAWADAPTSNPSMSSIGLTPAHVAYLIYTSGSTGRPKGVMVEHRQVSRLLAATEGWFAFDETDVWSLFHSYAFDFSVWEIWGALAYGGRLVVVPQALTRSPDLGQHVWDHRNDRPCDVSTIDARGQ
jgi:non-ribosomal peptide synthetase component F